MYVRLLVTIKQPNCAVSLWSFEYFSTLLLTRIEHKLLQMSVKIVILHIFIFLLHYRGELDLFSMFYDWFPFINKLRRTMYNVKQVIKNIKDLILDEIQELYSYDQYFISDLSYE